MKTHKVMTGLELLTKAVEKAFKPRGINLTESHNNALKEQAYERSQQTKGKEEGKKG